MKVLQKVLQAMPWKNHFWFHKEPFSQSFFKEPSLAFYNLKNLLSPQRKTFVNEKGSSDVKGSLWNHLHKQVILWHREEPLFLRV